MSSPSEIDGGVDDAAASQMEASLPTLMRNLAADGVASVGPAADAYAPADRAVGEDDGVVASTGHQIAVGPYGMLGAAGCALPVALVNPAS